MNKLNWRQQISVDEQKNNSNLNHESESDLNIAKGKLF